MLPLEAALGERIGPSDEEWSLIGPFVPPERGRGWDRSGDTCRMATPKRNRFALELVRGPTLRRTRRHTPPGSAEPIIGFRQTRLGPLSGGCCVDCFYPPQHERQLVITEVNKPAIDEDHWRSERAALDRLVRSGAQRLFDLVALRPSGNLGPRQATFIGDRDQLRRVVEIALTGEIRVERA